MQLSDHITGLFLVALGAVTAYAGSRLPPVPGQQIGPNVFPMVIGSGLVLCGALIAFRVGRHFEEEAEADLAAHSAPGTAPAEKAPWWRGLMALIPPALLLFYVLAADRLGFLITAAAMVLTAALALGARLRLAVPLALAAPVAVHLVFSKLLRVPLPPGLLDAPW
jgi:putative tricarboxylic transport membrane protein